jgi:hypothetical protein
MFHAGRRNDSRVLLVLFALWVLSPFMVVVLANVVSKRWSVQTRAPDRKSRLRPDAAGT